MACKRWSLRFNGAISLIDSYFSVTLYSKNNNDTTKSATTTPMTTTTELDSNVVYFD